MTRTPWPGCAVRGIFEIVCFKTSKGKSFSADDVVATIIMWFHGVALPCVHCVEPWYVQVGVFSGGERG